VSIPFGTNQRYDLIVDLGDRLVRVQCKTGRLRDGTIKFATQTVRVNTRRGNDSRRRLLAHRSSAEQPIGTYPAGA
jgi:hypothetical protein